MVQSEGESSDVSILGDQQKEQHTTVSIGFNTLHIERGISKRSGDTPPEAAYKMREMEKNNAGFEDDDLKDIPDPNTVNSTCHLVTYGDSYIYQPDMSLSKLTIEALPSLENYSKIDPVIRPTIEELMMGEKTEKIEEEVVKVQLKGKIVKFGWAEGVFMRCLLNIWGVMLFLRLSWVIGQAGLIQGLIIITLCNVITGVTAISMSAVATNGQISSGGVYYMISRALGPEFGGAIGLMFTVANSVAVATHTLGFCDSLLDLVYDVSDFNGIVATNEDRINDLRIIGAPTLVLILSLAIIGMDWVTRVQKFLLFLLIVSQFDMVIGSFFPYETAFITTEVRHANGFTGWSIETCKENLFSSYSTGSNGDKETFASVFGVFFTAVTGIVAGANLSGDLKDPSYAIPKGTLMAIGMTYVSYMFYGVMIAFTFTREASGNIEEYLDTSGLLPDVSNCTEEANLLRMYYNLNHTTCTFGASKDQKVMTYLSGTGYLVYFGCYAATLSSAIASLVGAPRVLQAVGRDKIYPKIEFFAVGHGANNDPFRGYILVFCIAFGTLMIAQLNTIGKLASNFFLAAYALMNLSVFHSSMTNSPGWRPSFKFYNPWVSLAASCVCVALMFLIEWRLALSTIGAISILYAFMLYLKPEANWGSSAEALVFNNALNNSYALNEQKEHIKTYRPKILLLSGNPSHRQPLVDFANLLTKKISLLICTHILPENHCHNVESLKEKVETWLSDQNVRCYYTVSNNSSFSDGVKNAVMLSGIGKLSPNMIMMGYNSNKKDLKSIQEYFDALLFSFQKKMSVGILRLPNGTDYSSKVGGEKNEIHEKVEESEKQKKKLVTEYRGTDGRLLPKSLVNEIQQFRTTKREGFIDVWWLYDDGGLTLLLPHILKTRRQFADCKLRVYSLSNRPEDFNRNCVNFAFLLAKFRIDYSEVIIIPDITKTAGQEIRTEFDQILSEYPEGTIDKSDIVDNSERTNRILRTSELLREKSMNADLIAITLPLPRKNQCSAAMYLAWLDIMTRGLPPVLLTRGNQASVLTYYS